MVSMVGDRRARQFHGPNLYDHSAVGTLIEGELRRHSPLAVCHSLRITRAVGHGGVPDLQRCQPGPLLPYCTCVGLLPRVSVTSEQSGLEWRCSDSLSLTERVPGCWRCRDFCGVCRDHSWLSRTRARLPHEVHTAVFDSEVLAHDRRGKGLVKGERIGVDASTMDYFQRGSLRNIGAEAITGSGGLPAPSNSWSMRLGPAERYRDSLHGIEDLARLGPQAQGKKLSNQDWVSRSDPESKIAKIERWHHAPGLRKARAGVDLDTGARGGPAAHAPRPTRADTTTLPKTLAVGPEANRRGGGCDAIGSKMPGRMSVTALRATTHGWSVKALDDGPWKSSDLRAQAFRVLSRMARR